MKLLSEIFSIIISGFSFFMIGCAAQKEDGEKRVRLQEPRIKPLAESEWSAEQHRILSPFRMADGSVFNIFTTIANHPKLFDKLNSLGLYVLRESTLPVREREILILRIGWLCRSEYEFGQHRMAGKFAGLTAEEIERIMEGPEAGGWDPFDATLLRAVDELHHDAFITDATWNALSKRYTRQQIMDVIATVGQYNLVSMLLNSLGVQLDKGIPGFPEGKDK